jgi:rod shape-determining protein MreC
MDPTRLYRFLRERLSGRRLDGTIAAIALILALLPARVLSGWTSDVARIVAVPIVPLMHGGMALRDWLRPPRDAFDPRAPEVVELEMAAERYRSLFEQSRLKTESLEREVLELKGIRSRLAEQGFASDRVQLATASVVGTDPTRTEGLVRLNVGSRHGVHRDAPVIARGDVFAGVVAQDPSEFVALVRPASRCSLAVRLYPASGVEPERPAGAFAGTVLKPADGGIWLGDIFASDLDVRAGDLARLADERLGDVARGLRVGVVRRIVPNEENPLVRRVEVEPLSALAQEPSVVVAILPTEGRP